ncbi:MAG: hypothetical protein WKG01_18795 [Kofleriaceae bacterium]
MRALMLGVITMLAACPLQGSKTATLGGGSPASSGDPEAVASSSGARDRKHFMEEDFASLKGLTVDQAKARAKELGHTGTITVTVSDEFVEGCKAGTVCEAMDARLLGGRMLLDQPMVLYTNKTLEIAPPPD